MYCQPDQMERAVERSGRVGKRFQNIVTGSVKLEEKSEEALLPVLQRSGSSRRMKKEADSHDLLSFLFMQVIGRGTSGDE